MTSWKRYCSLLLCLLLCLSFFPTAAFAAEPGAEETETAVETADAPAPEETAEEAESAAEDPAEDAAEATEATAPAEPAEGELDTEEPVEEVLIVPDEAEEILTDEPEAVTEDEPEEEIFVKQPVISYIPEGAADDPSLLEGYAKKQLDSLRPQGMSIQAIHDSSLNLTGVNRKVYHNLKAQIQAVAAGDRTSTKMDITVEELGLSKTSWTAADLGLESLVVETASGGKTFSQEAMAKVNEQVGFSLRSVITALLADCPYELYWYEKTMGTLLESYDFSGSELMISISGSMTFYFNVIGTYFDGVSYETLPDDSIARCGVKAETGEAVTNAVNYARGIANRYAGLSDYDKMLAYKDAICELVSYNYDALADGVDYGDPWQIIYVFDGNPNTNVVCEGYSKAFQYLCEIGGLSGNIMVYTVSGSMIGGTGAGEHMWNIVRMENGKRYIVDVTNSDEGSIGAPDKLFLAGATSGSVADGYTVTINDSSIIYQYASTMQPNYSESELTISGYSYLQDIGQHDAGIVWNLEQLKAAIAGIEAGDSVTLTYPGDADFYVGEDVAIPMGVTFRVPNGTLYVKSGATMTVNRLGTVLAAEARIDGALNVSAGGQLKLLNSTSNLIVNGSVENGGTVEAANVQVEGSMNILSGGKLNMSYSASVLSVNGTLTNNGTVTIWRPNFLPSAKMLGGSGSYVVKQKPGTEAQLRQIVNFAAAHTDISALSYELELTKAISLSSSLSVPANVKLTVNAALTIPAGVVLTNEGQIDVNAALTLAGKLINNSKIRFSVSQTMTGKVLNNGDMQLLENVGAAFGPYSGTGTLGIFKSDDSFANITGLTEDMFTLVLGYDNRFYGYRLLNPEGTDPSQVTAEVASISVDGTIGVNFKMKLSESVLERENVQAVFVYKTVEYPVSIEGMEPDSKGRYVFTYRVPAKEFANYIGLKFVDGNETIPMVDAYGEEVQDGLFWYSAEAYCDYIADTARVKPLINALRNYCAYSYQQFKSADDVAPAFVGDADVSAVTVDQLAAYQMTQAGSTTGLSLATQSLTLKSTTEINLKFTLESGHAIEDYSFFVDGAAVATKLSGSRYVVVIPNIAAKDLDTLHRVTVTHGEETMEIGVYGLTYAHTVLYYAPQYPSSYPESLCNVVKSMYLYNQAANAYFGS